jgi:hypothetical protein
VGYVDKNYLHFASLHQGKKFFLTKISAYISGCCVALEINHCVNVSFKNKACPKKQVVSWYNLPRVWDRVN